MKFTAATLALALVAASTEAKDHNKHSRGIRALKHDKQNRRVLPGKGKGGKGKGKGKGKGCFKFDYTVELMNTDKIGDIGFDITFEDADGEVYYKDIDIEADALSGMELADKYEACGIPCYNATKIEKVELQITWDDSATPEDNIKKVMLEIGGVKAEVAGEDLPNADCADECNIVWEIVDDEETFMVDCDGSGCGR